MPTGIDRAELQRLLSSGAQLLEVLPREEYEEQHLPSALNVPLRRLDATSVEKLDQARPVIVYCWDSA